MGVWLQDIVREHGLGLRPIGWKPARSVTHSAIEAHMRLPVLYEWALPLPFSTSGATRNIFWGSKRRKFGGRKSPIEIYRATAPVWVWSIALRKKWLLAGWLIDCIWCRELEVSVWLRVLRRKPPMHAQVIVLQRRQQLSPWKRRVGNNMQSKRYVRLAYVRKLPPGRMKMASGSIWRRNDDELPSWSFVCMTFPAKTTLILEP